MCLRCRCRRTPHTALSPPPSGQGDPQSTPWRQAAGPELHPFGVLGNRALFLRGARGVRPRYAQYGCTELAKVSPWPAGLCCSGAVGSSEVCLGTGTPYPSLPLHLAHHPSAPGRLLCKNHAAWRISQGDPTSAHISRCGVKWIAVKAQTGSTIQKACACFTPKGREVS